MPSLKEDVQRARVKAAALWAQAKERWAAHPASRHIKKPSRKATLWTLGSIFGVLVAAILFLGIFDWNYLKGPVQKIASNMTHRTVRIDGDLDVNILSWTPGARIEGLRISNPEWLGKGDMANIGDVEVKVKLLPLFKGDVILPLLKIDNGNVVLLQDLKGRNNWTFGDPKKKKKKPFTLPAIRDFQINNGKLKITDEKRKLVFTGTVTSSEQQGNRSVQAFKLLGDGTLNGEPFAMTVTGGPLLNVDPDRPYPFNARVTAGSTKATAVGNIRKPFDLAVFDTTLAVSGRDLAKLYYLTGIALPNTPPYEISGKLSRRGFVYSYEGIDGRVGDSDLHGRLSVTTGGERLRVNANLNSKRLVFDDLAAILGAKPKQMTVAQAQAEGLAVSSGRLFPDTPLRVERLRDMDATLKYRATSVTSSMFPVRYASVNLTLERGLLTLDDLVFGFPQGRLAGKVVINARKDVPGVDMDVRLTGARLEQFIPAQFKGAISGGVIGRAKLTSSGLSVRDAAANANGQVTLVIPQGEMRAALAELLGVNVLKGLGLLFSDEDQKTGLRCAVADFRATKGVLNAQTIVFDTEPVIVTGDGTINLGTERMALRVKGHPKEARLLRLSVPIRLNGTLTKPSLGVVPSTAVAQGGLGALLGSILTPVAAILPFVDVGLAEDANCSALTARAGKPGPKVATPEAAAKPAGKPASKPAASR
jgi:uncharacterized protein involved in outer membrane biogenesis